MGMGVFQQREPKNLRRPKIGAAISGPRTAGRKITDMRFFFYYLCRTPKTLKISQRWSGIIEEKKIRFPLHKEDVGNHVAFGKAKGPPIRGSARWSLYTPRIWRVHFLPNPTLQSCSLAELWPVPSRWCLAEPSKLPNLKPWISGRKEQPKHKGFGRDVRGTMSSGTQTSGYPVQKLYASGLFSVVLDREWPGCPGIWIGTSRIWKNFTQENFGSFF